MRVPTQNFGTIAPTRSPTRRFLNDTNSIQKQILERERVPEEGGSAGWKISQIVKTDKMLIRRG